MDEKKMIELWDKSRGDIYVYADLVAEHEREACAKRLDAVGATHCAENIRLRGQE